MKTAAVSMVKNECDIIELFVKINLRTFDHLYIVDHDSSDGTRIILDRMKQSGFPITIFTLSDIHQSQAETITRIVRDVANTDAYDYIMPLDADEFLAPGRPGHWQALDTALSENAYGLVPWKTFVPVSADFFGPAAPLYSNFRMRSCEPVQYYKVVIPNQVAKSCVINPGNHSMTSEQASSAVEVSMELLHVPVRSASQIIQKAVIGSHALSFKRNRMGTEGFHWDVLAREIRDKHYQLDSGDLLRFALAYGTTGNADEAIVSDQTRRIGLPMDVIDYVDQARIEPLAAFDAFLSKTCAEINSLSRVIESFCQKERHAALENEQSKVFAF